MREMEPVLVAVEFGQKVVGVHHGIGNDIPMWEE